MGLLSTLLGHASDLTPEQTREDLDGCVRIMGGPSAALCIYPTGRYLLTPPLLLQ